MEIGNEEVSILLHIPFLLLMNVDTLQIADMLPAKTVPEVKNKKKQTCALKHKAVTVPPKKNTRVRLAEVEEIEDEKSMCNLAGNNSSISPSSSFQMLDIMEVSCVIILHCRGFDLIRLSESTR